MITSHEDMHTWAQEHLGEVYTLRELLRIHGYSPSTFFKDTYIYKHHAKLMPNTRTVQII